MKTTVIAALVLAGVAGAAGVVGAEVVRAPPPPTPVSVEVKPFTAASMPGFQHDCNGTASRVAPSTGDQGYVGLWVWNGTSSAGASSTPVFFGDDVVTMTTGMPLCSGTSCPQAAQDYAVHDLYCITAGSTVTITAQRAHP